MKKFISPELELIRLDVVDIITASGETAPATSTAKPSVSIAPDAGLDNEVSANKWVFPDAE